MFLLPFYFFPFVGGLDTDTNLTSDSDEEICDDSKLIGLICLGSNGYPTETSGVSYQIRQQGYENIAKKRREELLSKLEDITDDMIKQKISPPIYEVVCDVKEW